MEDFVILSIAGRISGQRVVILAVLVDIINLLCDVLTCQAKLVLASKMTYDQRY